MPKAHRTQSANGAGRQRITEAIGELPHRAASLLLNASGRWIRRRNGRRTQYRDEQHTR
jgi:hypothetical protein